MLIQNQSVRLNIIGNRECLSLPKENQNLSENDESREEPVLMDDIGNLRLQILEEFRNMKSFFWTKIKSFKNEFLQSCAKQSSSEKVHGNSMSEISERFKPSRRAKIVSKGTTKKQRQDHKPINNPTLKKQ